jgi:hypothetical protein
MRIDRFVLMLGIYIDVIMLKNGLRTCNLNDCVSWLLADKLVNWENNKIYVGCIMVIRMWKSMLNASWKYEKM